MDTNLLYTGPDHKHNWFYNKYWYNGANQRYFTFQIAMNLLNQLVENPVIIETGCQRQQEDLGAGMSTSIFAEYVSRYGGMLISVDNIREHLERAVSYVAHWDFIDFQPVLSDSVAFLESYNGPCDLLYLDSLDYPVGEHQGDERLQEAAQKHCLAEFEAFTHNNEAKPLVLLDDNSLPGGGKPKLLKEFLIETGWTCIFDLQQSLWLLAN